MRTLRVGGLQKFTTIDYPGQLAAVVFVAGCPWHCPYCHNADLRAREASSGLQWHQVLAWLMSRAGLLDAVVFSGGEPTLDPELAGAMRAVRQAGFRVGLHTAGVSPRRLLELLPLVDWVGLDVKAPLDDDVLHEQITGVAGSATAARESVQMVLDAGLAHEFRTTAHPQWLDDAAVVALALDLHDRGAQCFALQVARTEGIPDARLGPVPADYPAASTLAHLRSLFAHFTLRRE